jgi:hypothetical protein
MISAAGPEFRHVRNNPYPLRLEISVLGNSLKVVEVSVS